MPRLHDIVIKTDLDEEVRASGFDEDKRHNLLVCATINPLHLAVNDHGCSLAMRTTFF